MTYRIIDTTTGSAPDFAAISREPWTELVRPVASFSFEGTNFYAVCRDVDAEWSPRGRGHRFVLAPPGRFRLIEIEEP